MWSCEWQAVLALIALVYALSRTWCASVPTWRVTHAAARDGAMVATVEKCEEREHKVEVDAGCYELWLAAVETFRRLGEKFMKLLR